MASREIEQFRRHGLGSPICIKPGLRSYLFLLFAGPLLIGGSVHAATRALVGSKLIFFFFCELPHTSSSMTGITKAPSHVK